MPFLYNIGVGENKERKLLLSENELRSLLYHDVFDYPLTAGEIVKWTVGSGVEIDIKQEKRIEEKNGLYYLKGKEGVVYKRLLKKRISARKIQIAKKAADMLSIVPSIKMVAITGSLAMENASDDSDIDLLLVTSKDTLWTTRLSVLVMLKLLGIPIRRFGDKNQKDKLCMNIWLDEKALSWSSRDRNVYTAHEIAQIKPLISKNKMYEKFIYENRWIGEFWPNAVHVKRISKACRFAVIEKKLYPIRYILYALEFLARKIQFMYMKKKITREVVGNHRAIFHPHDWGEIVLRQLTSTTCLRRKGVSAGQASLGLDRPIVDSIK